MFKKIFLMTACFAVATPEKINTHNDNQAAIAIVGAGILGTAVYWAMRERNDSVMARAQQLLEQNKILVQEADAYLSQECNFLTSDVVVAQNSLDASRAKLSSSYDQLSSVYSTIQARYDSFLTPWNWSDAMFQMGNELKSALELNNVANINIQGLLGRVNYVLCLTRYKQALETINGFVVQNKNICKQKISFFESINSVQELYQSKEIIEVEQIELNQFFIEYKQLGEQLKQVKYSLNVQDRNIQIESDFAVIGQQAESLLDILDKQTKFLNLYLRYKGCIEHINYEYLLIKEVRKIVGGSSYPLIDFISKLNADIKFLKNICINQAVFAQNIIEALLNIKNALIVSNEYVAECRVYEIYLEQQRQAEAAVKAARAAQEAADAAQCQARAAQESAAAAQRQARAAEEQNRLNEEQNRLKREENRINQERNNIERNKQQDNKNNNNRW